jgi:L-arabinokinase
LPISPSGRYNRAVVITLVCYISGHGFGHAVRVTEVLRQLWGRRPDVHVEIRSWLPRSFFDFELHGSFRYTQCRLDVGAVQRDSLSVDPEASLRAYADLIAQREALIAGEVQAMAAVNPAAMLADIPALAFDIAGRLGLPGIAMANFSWDWIYADYVHDFPSYAYLLDDCRASYAQASVLLRLPLHGDLSVFPRIRDIPLVARTATLTGSDVRTRLGLPPRDRLVLLSFGGIGVDLRVPPNAPRGVTFVVTQSAANRAVPPPCRLIADAEMSAAQVRHQDLVGACDAVMTKPGYGIVSECIANATPIVYTARGRFAEYACLVEGIRTHLPHAFISNDDLYAGRWMPALEAVFAQPRRQPAVATNGAEVAADVILDMLRELAIK